MSPIAIVVKATLVLALAALASFGLRHASAAVRHLVWLIALGGCTALVLLSPAAPEIALRIPVAAQNEGGLFPVVPVRMPPLPAAGQPAGYAPLASYQSLPAALSKHRSPWRLPQFAVVVWALGFLLVLGRCAVGHVAVRRLVGNARHLTGEDWDAALDAAARDVGLTRRVGLKLSENPVAPITFGLCRPVVLLSSDAAEWTEERRRVVLVHELAHVERFDYLAQLVATVTCALFWFHPGVWAAAARLRAEAEHAADDRVLGAGTTGVAYASHLLELAGRQPTRHLSTAIAVGMIRSPRLEGRFRAMLDMTRSRAAVSPRTQATVATLAFGLMLPVAGVRVTNAAPGMRSSAAQSRAAKPPQPEPRRITATFERAPIAEVIETFATLSRRTILAGKSVTGLVSAAIVDQPWDSALHAVMRTHGYDVTEDTSGVIHVDARNREGRPAFAAHPDLSGTWAFDTSMTADHASVTVTITQTPTLIIRFPLFRLISRDGALAPLEGSLIGVTMTANGAAADVGTTGAWVGDTLVTTNKGVHDGTAWELVERWSLRDGGNSLVLVVGPGEPPRGPVLPKAKRTFVLTRRPSPYPLPGNPAPQYPERLSADGIEGGAIVEFSVNQRGIPDTSTVRIIESTHELFASAVRSVLPLWRFDGGGVVRLPVRFLTTSTEEKERAGQQPPRFVNDPGPLRTVIVVTVR